MTRSQTAPRRTRSVHRPRVIDYEDALAAARRRFLHTGEVDMEELSRDLAVSRATLYRVVEGRDQLLGDVLWSLGEPILTEARRRRTRPGADGVIEIAQAFSDEVLASEPYLRFMAAHPDTAARILFAPTGGVHGRFVAAQEQILRECYADVDEPLPFDVERVAEVFIRILESMAYADLLRDRLPDLELTERVARALLEAA